MLDEFPNGWNVEAVGEDVGDNDGVGREERLDELETRLNGPSDTTSEREQGDPIRITGRAATVSGDPSPSIQK